MSNREDRLLEITEWLAENLDVHIGKVGRDEPFDELLTNTWEAARAEGWREALGAATKEVYAGFSEAALKNKRLPSIEYGIVEALDRLIHEGPPND